MFLKPAATKRKLDDVEEDIQTSKVQKVGNNNQEWQWDAEDELIDQDSSTYCADNEYSPSTSNMNDESVDSDDSSKDMKMSKTTSESGGNENTSKGMRLVPVVNKQRLDELYFKKGSYGESTGGKVHEGERTGTVQTSIIRNPSRGNTRQGNVVSNVQWNSDVLPDEVTPPSITTEDDPTTSMSADLLRQRSIVIGIPVVQNAPKLEERNTVGRNYTSFDDLEKEVLDKDTIVRAEKREDEPASAESEVEEEPKKTK